MRFGIVRPVIRWQGAWDLGLAADNFAGKWLVIYRWAGGGCLQTGIRIQDFAFLKKAEEKVSVR